MINNVHPILSKWNMIVFFIRSKEPKNVLHIALIYDIYWSKTGNSYQIYTMITINLISNLTWVVSYAVVRTWVPSPVPPGDWPARWRKCRLCQWPNHWRRTESCWKITIELTLSLHCHKWNIEIDWWILSLKMGKVFASLCKILLSSNSPVYNYMFKYRDYD